MGKVDITCPWCICILVKISSINYWSYLHVSMSSEFEYEIAYVSDQHYLNVILLIFYCFYASCCCDDVFRHKTVLSDDWLKHAKNDPEFKDLIHPTVFELASSIFMDLNLYFWPCFRSNNYTKYKIWLIFR